MISLKNTLRRRTDDNIFRCVTVDNENWKKFSFHKFDGDKEITNKSFEDMWDAINYFNNEIAEYMKPWMKNS